MTDWTQEMLTLATQAGNAFEELRDQLRDAAVEQAKPPAGTMVGDRYEVVRELGEGGFGNVFEVRHHILGHRFAMKLLNARVAADPTWVERFREEARATSRIGHENIVFVTDFGEDRDWGSYFVMEYLDGQPLDRVLDEEGTQPPERILRFLRAAASALAAVHEVGIIHCDLKPSNVFVIPSSRQPELWKFLDFGTSTVVMESVETDVLYGTPKYMAPEQAIGAPLSPKADQFSVACIVYEMATGQLPWDVPTWLMAMPEARAKKLPAPPSSLGGDCPPAWDEPILRALAIDPDDRWPAIDDFARALLERLDLDWRPMVDPLDLSGDAAGGFKRTSTAPSVEIAPPREPPSVVIDVETGEESDERSIVTLGFRTRERFMREYRRNLAVGGLFVPSDDLLALRSMVRVILEYAPTGARCELNATVVGHETRREAGRGFGLAIDSGLEVVERFVVSIDGPDIGVHDVLTLAREATETELLSPGEGFVISRVEDDGTTLARLRAICAGLPFDVDELVAGLMARGLLVASDERQRGRPRLSDTTTQDRRNAGASMCEEEIASVLERVEFHRRQANYLGARDLLRRAIDISPGIGEFHYRLALLRREFADDSVGAAASARRAVELEPENERYRELLDSLLGVA